MTEPRRIDIHEAKKHLGAVLEDVESGRGTVLILRDGKPVMSLAIVAEDAVAEALETLADS